MMGNSTHNTVSTLDQINLTICTTAAILKYELIEIIAVVAVLMSSLSPYPFPCSLKQ